MRNGLLEELDAVFAAADEMVGCGDPAEFEGRRAAIEALRVEVVDLLKRGGDLARRASRLGRRPDLRERLVATGDAQLVEGNAWGDRYWGQCPVGVGENVLGALLMQVRGECRS